LKSDVTNMTDGKKKIFGVKSSERYPKTYPSLLAKGTHERSSDINSGVKI